MEKFKPEIGGLVIDIGSNDGILLKYFADYNMQVLGIFIKIFIRSLSYKFNPKIFYSKEFTFERMYRDAPLLLIGEGTNEILRTVISRQLIERNPI